MARIYLDAWGMKGEPNGVGRYCRGLVPQLIAEAPQHEFIILRPSIETSPAPIAAGAREVVVPLRRTYFGNLVSRPLIHREFHRFGRPDLYHALFQALPLGLKRGRFRPRSVVVTLHDLIWIDHPHEYQFGVNWF